MTTDALTVREVSPADLAQIVELDALRSGRSKPEYWAEILRLYAGGGPRHVAVAAVDGADLLVGFLFGEVRAWEFGSEPCGWVFSVAVRPEVGREGIATALCEEAMRRFRAAGVDVVRTMVRRNDVPLLSFFRSLGFVGGPFAELERAIPAPDEGEPT